MVLALPIEKAERFGRASYVTSDPIALQHNRCYEALGT